MKVCPGLLSVEGSTCGRAIKAYVAPGHGRCGRHATARERAVVTAVLRAERELRELRDVPPAAEDQQTQDGEQARRDENAERWLPPGWTELDERAATHERRHRS